MNGALPSLPSPTMPNFSVAAQPPNGPPSSESPVYSNGMPPSAYANRKHRTRHATRARDTRHAARIQ